MKHNDMLFRHNQILKSMSSIPRKMLSLHGYENVPEFVLHELCHQACFNFSRAAYFVDNPDFDCFKGIAGFSQQEAVPTDTLWQEPDSFTLIMQSSPFNQKVREILRPSPRKSNEADFDIVEGIAQHLHLVDPQFYAWNMKYDNHGILIYEKNNLLEDTELQEHLQNGVCLLSFCPIF